MRYDKFIWLSLLLAISFSVPAFSQQSAGDFSFVSDTEPSAPMSHGVVHDHDGMAGDHEGMAGDHEGMAGDHEGMAGDHEGMAGDHEGMAGDHEGMGGGHHRVDHLEPAFVKCMHVHEAGDWMVGYEYSNTYMGGSQAGTTSLTNQQALNYGGNMYMMAPTGMTMEMHMAHIMRGITDDITAYVMPTWMDNTMDMFVRGGTTFRSSNGGFSDLPFGALWRIYQGPADEVVADIGFSAPTGDINNITSMPMGMMPMVFPYTMRLGHGTWDACPGIVYRHYWDRASIGFQCTFDLPMGMNDEQYRVGNEYRATAWLAYLLDSEKSVAATFRVEGLWQSNYVGADSRLDPTMMSDSNPSMRGSDNLNFAYGLMWRLPKHLGVLEGEFLQPIFQNFQGVQETTLPSFAVRYMVRF